MLGDDYEAEIFDLAETGQMKGIVVMCGDEEPIDPAGPKQVRVFPEDKKFATLDVAMQKADVLDKVILDILIKIDNRDVPMESGNSRTTLEENLT